MAEKMGKKKTVRKTVEQLEQELKELKESNKAAWDTYGSELCVESMLAGERILEEEISKRKAIALKRKTIKKWSKAGLLEGLNLNTIYKINENQRSFILNKTNDESNRTVKGDKTENPG
jgi:hypothetical protein